LHSLSSFLILKRIVFILVLSVAINDRLFKILSLFVSKLELVVHGAFIVAFLLRGLGAIFGELHNLLLVGNRHLLLFLKSSATLLGRKRTATLITDGGSLQQGTFLVARLRGKAY